MQGNKKEELILSLQVAGTVALACVLATAVYFYVKKTSDLEGAIDVAKLQDFSSPTAEIKNFVSPILPGDAAAGIDSGARATKYVEVGSAILSVTPQNITAFTPQEFLQLGQTPWSIMNTVAANQGVPGVVSVVFDNRNVIDGFLNRPTTNALLRGSEQLIAMIEADAPALQNFFKNPAVAQTLDNEPMMLAIASSALAGEVLNTPAAQYFIQNPLAARRLANASPTLAPLLSNESLKKILLATPQTAQAAQLFYR